MLGHNPDSVRFEINNVSLLVVYTFIVCTGRVGSWMVFWRKADIRRDGVFLTKDSQPFTHVNVDRTIEVNYSATI